VTCCGLATGWYFQRLSAACTGRSNTPRGLALTMLMLPTLPSGLTVKEATTWPTVPARCAAGG